LRTAFRLCWLAVLLASCGGPGVDGVRNLDGPPVERIAAFGDSLTEGTGVEPGQAWPARLGTILGVPVDNFGRAGDTTASGLARLDEVLDAQPRLVIVGLGGNDFLRRVPREETERNLAAIVGRLQDGGAAVVVLGMNIGLFTDEYSPICARVAKRTGAWLIPEVLDDVLDDPSNRQDDRIHPNAAGHRLMAERIAEGLKPLLERMEP
jgi:acyl-CoA thioesterase-1